MENLGLVQHQNTPFYLVWQLFVVLFAKAIYRIHTTHLPKFKGGNVYCHGKEMRILMLYDRLPRKCTLKDSKHHQCHLNRSG